MRLGAIFLVLLCSSICISNGAPPKQVPGGKKVHFGFMYTPEEDRLIIDELQNVLDNTKKPQSISVWGTIAQKHHEKRMQGITGFSHERSATSLRLHFIQVLSRNRGNTTVKVPQALIQKFNNKVTRQPYTNEEENFIIEELSKPSYTGVFGPSTLEALSREHAKKREAGISGFENVRSSGSFRKHLITMKNAGQFPQEVLGKYHFYETGTSTTQFATSSEQAGLQVTNEGERGDDWIADMIEELQNNTDCEIDFSKLE